MIKTNNPKYLLEKAELLTFETIGFDPDELMKGGSFCLIEGDDLGLFEKQSDGIYSCHYFFKSRGRQAVEVAKRMAEYAFDDGASVLTGLTPLTNLGALWVTKRLGSRFINVISTDLGDMQVSMLTKKDLL